MPDRSTLVSKCVAIHSKRLRRRRDVNGRLASNRAYRASTLSECWPPSIRPNVSRDTRSSSASTLSSIRGEHAFDLVELLHARAPQRRLRFLDQARVVSTTAKSLIDLHEHARDDLALLGLDVESLVRACSGAGCNRGLLASAGAAGSCPASRLRGNTAWFARPSLSAVPVRRRGRSRARRKSGRRRRRSRTRGSIVVSESAAARLAPPVSAQSPCPPHARLVRLDRTRARTAHRCRPRSIQRA